MKKFMTTVLAAALVFAAAGQASATALETSGEYRGRFWYMDNYSTIPAAQESQDFWDQRLRVKMAWKISDAVTVNARADILEYVWDTSTNETDTSHIPGKPSQAEIDFDWAYADMAIAANTRLQVGKMDVTWGPGVYAKADSRYRARIASKIGEIPVAFAYDKMNEQHLDAGLTHEEDWDGYSLGTVIPLAGWKLGVLGVYSDNNPSDSDLLGLDVTAEGMLGPAKFVFEGAYGAGESSGVDQSGLMGYAGAFLPIGPVNCGFEAAYARGDEPGGDIDSALSHDYNGPFSSFILYNQFDLNGWVSNYNDSARGTTDLGVQNSLALKASATFAFSKQLSLMGAGVWAVADEKGARDSDEYGVEVDGLLKYALNENVTLQTGVGYLFAGDYFGEVDDPLVVTAHAIVAF